jgi:hypothetical protein
MECWYWKIPSTIDLNSILAKDPPSFKTKYKVDHFYYFIELLTIKMEYNDLDSNKGFINLSAELMQKVVRNYKEYLEYLIRNKIVRTDKKYIVGRKSMGYILNGLKYNSEVARIEIMDSNIRKNRAKEFRKNELDKKNVSSKYSYLTKWFNDKLQIDTEGANDKIEELFPEPKGGIKGARRGKASKTTKKYSAKLAIKKIEGGDFYYKVDDNVGRFHSNLTNIKKELRHYITYDGQTLVNVDIKNSQPLLSSVLFDPSFYTNKKKGQRVNLYDFPSLFQYLVNNNKYTYTHTIIMLVKTLQKLDNKEVKKYLRMAKSGNFYEYLSKAMYPKQAFDKGRMKELTYKVFFSSNKSIQGMNNWTKKEFKWKFKGLYKMFSAIKRKNHRALSHILQRIESEIMIQNVCKRISLEQPTLPIFTIHDSVLTTDGNQEYVAKIIKEEAFKLTGLKVSLGIEILNQNKSCK